MHSLHHVGYGLGHALDQAESQTEYGEASTRRDDHREEGVAILPRTMALSVAKLHGDVADDRRLQIARQGKPSRLVSAWMGCLKYDVIAVERDAGQRRDGAAIETEGTWLPEVPVW